MAEGSLAKPSAHLSLERKLLLQWKSYLEEQVLGQQEAVELSLIALLSKGHILLEGPPGVGKTSLAQGIASSFQGSFRRVQMTSDLLPSDIVGTLRLRPGAADFDFRPGPIFSHVLLADELNRTGPKTQAALLEAMAESSVTVDGVTHALPQPFLVLATQNPQEFEGVYPLSESQLDRFMVHISLGLPAAEEELRLLKRHAQVGTHTQATKAQVLSPSLLATLQAQVEKVFVEETLLAYVQAIAHEVRHAGDVTHGASVRAILQWIDASKGRAFLSNRDFVTPEDIQVTAPYVLGHRLCLRGADLPSKQRKEIIRNAMARVAAPK